MPQTRLAVSRGLRQQTEPGPDRVLGWRWPQGHRTGLPQVGHGLLSHLSHPVTRKHAFLFTVVWTEVQEAHCTRAGEGTLWSRERPGPRPRGAPSKPLPPPSRRTVMSWPSWRTDRTEYSDHFPECQNDMIFPRTIPEPVAHWHYFQLLGEWGASNLSKRMESFFLCLCSVCLFRLNLKCILVIFEGTSAGIRMIAQPELISPFQFISLERETVNLK